MRPTVVYGGGGRGCCRGEAVIASDKRHAVMQGCWLWRGRGSLSQETVAEIDRWRVCWRLYGWHWRCAGWRMVERLWQGEVGGMAQGEGGEVNVWLAARMEWEGGIEGRMGLVRGQLRYRDIYHVAKFCVNSKEVAIWGDPLFAREYRTAIDTDHQIALQFTLADRQTKSSDRQDLSSIIRAVYVIEDAPQARLRLKAHQTQSQIYQIGRPQDQPVSPPNQAASSQWLLYEDTFGQVCVFLKNIDGIGKKRKRQTGFQVGKKKRKTGFSASTKAKIAQAMEVDK
ncbi:hypothetical protein KSP40_PGU017963 [Platanthera guangdongensis]|uniref:Uncharacterized protein n=1 Tax=Platanthera guangdongensis TaxID=2320717 RepID=A0ABR2MRT8_9ASPA